MGTYRVNILCTKCKRMDYVHATDPQEEFVQSYKDRNVDYLCPLCWGEQYHNDKEKTSSALKDVKNVIK